MIYTLLGLYMEKKKPIVGHETGVILVIGITISTIVHATATEERSKLL